ncbi:tetratricopeptide repeat protein [Streptomyces sp. RKAG293]|nr:tetratricopeptide repeat protein [Streptomyces sp. RKAG293]
MGDYAAALALATLAGDISQSMHGEDHPDTLAARHQQGDALQRLGQLREAERLLRHVHRRRALVLGDDDPRTLQSAVALSIPLYLLGQYDECLLRLDRAIAGQRRILGDEHVETLNSRARIMEFYIDSGHLARFSEQGPATVTDCERHLGTGHPLSLKGRLSLAERLAAAGQHPEALQLLQDNLTAAEHIFGTHDADLARGPLHHPAMRGTPASQRRHRTGDSVSIGITNANGARIGRD